MILDIENLEVSYGKIRAIKGISLNVKQGGRSCRRKWRWKDHLVEDDLWFVEPVRRINQVSGPRPHEDLPTSASHRGHLSGARGARHLSRHDC